MNLYSTPTRQMIIAQGFLQGVDTIILEITAVGMDPYRQSMLTDPPAENLVHCADSCTALTHHTIGY